jgi:PEGA domain
MRRIARWPSDRSARRLAAQVVSGRLDSRREVRGSVGARVRIGAAVVLAVAVTMVPPQLRAGQRRVAVGGGAGRVYGPGFYSGWYPGWYAGWYGPAWRGPRYYYGPRAGTVEIEARVKGNSVYVDDGYAGLTGKLKKFPLRPGKHTIAIRDAAGHTIYEQKIEVLMGKTLKIYPAGRD